MPVIYRLHYPDRDCHWTAFVRYATATIDAEVPSFLWPSIPHTLFRLLDPILRRFNGRIVDADGNFHLIFDTEEDVTVFKLTFN